MTKKIYIKLLVVFQVVVLGFILIGCNKNEEENKERIQKMDFVLNERVPNRTNADNLNVMANINIILSIIGAILIWANFGTQEIRHKGSYWETGYTETVANWYGILGGVAVLIAGFTVFFLLKTIIDIYFEVEKQ